MMALLGLVASAGLAPAERAPFMVGYSELEVDLPGRHANTVTMRAYAIKGDGSGRSELAPELAAEPNTWSQMAGWSPDGRLAIVGQGWESGENGAWEEEHGAFRMTPGNWRYDTFLVGPETGAAESPTAVERVSHYNSGLFFWPDDPSRLGFTALIDGESRPFSMNRDGTGKQDLSADTGFTYGFEASPDGTRIAYHRNYQVCIADADGSNATHIDAGNPFNFCPKWSPTGDWLLFLSGEHHDCHPHLVAADGSALRKLADRGGWRGVVPVLDVPDFHGGSSDVPVWSRDGRWVYYAAQVGEAVELMRVSLGGEIEQLTQSPPGAMNYHPSPSPDGEWLLFGSTRTGRRQLHIARAGGSGAYQLTQAPEAHAAMWGQWRPMVNPQQ